MVTSRVVLGVRIERVQPVGPLPITAGTPDDPDEIDATGFLVARAHDLGGYVPRDADLPVLSEIARALDGLALELELAAARLRVLTPTALRNQLAARHDVLGGVTDLPDGSGRWPRCLRGAPACWTSLHVTC